MRSEGTTEIPCVAIQGRQRDGQEHATGKRGRGRRERSPRSSSEGCNPLAFLNEKLEDYPIEGLLDQYSINLEGSYKKIRVGVERFLAAHDLKLSYIPKKGEEYNEMLVQMMEEFGKLLEPMGFGCMMHKDDYEPILDAAVYAYGGDMDYTIGEIYVRPAETLPPEESMLFKRFIKLFSSETNIGLGLDCESFFIETQMDYFEGYYEDENFENLDEEEKEWANFRKQVAANYKEGGKYFKLFKEIDSLSVNRDELKRDLQEYMKKYKGNQEKFSEWRLMGVLLDGIDVVKFINIFDWTFNPDNDGVDSSAEDNFYSAASLLNFIFYSEHDTFGESVLDAVNNSCDEIMGWCNGFVITHENNFEDHLLYFEESVKAVPKFRQWLQDFYKSAEKFDTNEHITRPDEGQD